MCDCGSPDHLVTDVASGDVVCQQCGVVVEAHIFDEHLESYSDHHGPRAGPAESWLLPLQPIIVDNIPNRCRVMQNDDPHTSTRELFALIDNMGHAFCTHVLDTAKQLSRDLLEHRMVRGDARHLYAACALYMAAKMQGNGIGRSKKEIAAQFAPYGITERGLTCAAKMFKEALHAAPYSSKLLSGLEAPDLINRCVDRLGIDDQRRKLVKREAHILVAKVPMREVEGKTPSSICCGVVACALQQLEIKLSKKHLQESCRVSGATLDKMTKAMRKFAMA